MRKLLCCLVCLVLAMFLAAPTLDPTSDLL